MATNRTKGVRRLEVEIDDELWVELDAFAARYGVKFKRVVSDALRRHFDHPPPLPPPPPSPPALPPLPPLTAPPTAKKGARKQSGKAT